MREPLSVSRLADIIDQARGKAPADLVIKSVGIFDLTSGDVTVGDIAIAGDRIVGTHETYHGATEIDGRGLIAVPGFIDSHVHCESSLVPPLEFDRCVVPRGTTTAICDPHEICNVLGVPGLKFFLECAAVTVMDLRVQLSSCVPSTHLETSGARLEAEDLLPFKHHPKVLGLAEFMNVPGVLNKDPAVLAKLAAFSDVQIDGHSPLLSSYDLNAYIAAGVRNCHETTSAAEAREKLAKGMQILVREGTVSKDLAALGRADHHRARAVPGALHRRPQPARHRRGRPSRLPDPRRHRAAACGRSTPIAPRPGRRRAISAWSTAAWWRPANAPTSCCWKTLRPARCSR